MRRRRVGITCWAGAALVGVVAAGCGGGGTEAAVPASGPVMSTTMGVPVVPSIDVPGSRAALEAGSAEIRRILEAELGDSRGADGWTEARPAQENSSSSCGGVEGVGKFYAAEWSHPRALDVAAWDRAWAEIVRTVGAHGFAPDSDRAAGGATDGAADRAGSDAGTGHFEYLVNPHEDVLTVSSLPGVGTGYGGYSVCHPWEAPAGR